MWHVKIVDGVLKQEPGPLEPGASSRSLAEFVSHALAAEPGWCSADAGLFEVEDVSGCGGSKTYKVAATHVYSPQLRPSATWGPTAHPLGGMTMSNPGRPKAN